MWRRALRCDVRRPAGDPLIYARSKVGILLAKPFVTSVIIGAKRIEQLDQNLAAVTLKLDAGGMQKLDEVSAGAGISGLYACPPRR